MGALTTEITHDGKIKTIHECTQSVIKALISTNVFGQEIEKRVVQLDITKKGKEKKKGKERKRT